MTHLTKLWWDRLHQNALLKQVNISYIRYPIISKFCHLNYLLYVFPLDGSQPNSQYLHDLLTQLISKIQIRDSNSKAWLLYLLKPLLYLDHSLVISLSLKMDEILCSLLYPCALLTQFWSHNLGYPKFCIHPTNQMLQIDFHQATNAPLMHIYHLHIKMQLLHINLCFPSIFHFNFLLTFYLCFVFLIVHYLLFIMLLVNYILLLVILLLLTLVHLQCKITQFILFILLFLLKFHLWISKRTQELCLLTHNTTWLQFSIFLSYLLDLLQINIWADPSLLISILLLNH